MGMPEQKFKLRVTYKKVDNAAWLSQLELARALEHAVRRSQLPYSVSEGFVPHMRISFGPALSVGIQSQSQVFDVLLTRYIAPDKCLRALQEVSADDLMPTNAVYVDNNDVFELNGVNAFEVEIDQKIDAVKVPKSIEIVKKKKTKVLDVSDFLDGEVELSNSEGSTILSFKLKFFEDGSLNPEIFVKALLENSGLCKFKIKNFKKQ